MDLPAWVSGYVGIPFLDKGRGHDGADCWGLARLVWAEQYGLDLPSCVDDYADTREREEIERLIHGGMGPWREVPAGTERAGDGVLIRMVGADCHVGVVVAPGVMLHIEEGIDAALERYDTPKWARRLVGIYRHVE